MTIEIFKAVDYYALKSDVTRGFEFWTNKRLPALLSGLEETKMSRTVFDKNGEVLAIYGMCELFDGVAEVFFIPALGWERAKLSVCRAAKKDLTAFKRFYRRIQMVCLDSPIHRRFADFLGFSTEGFLRNYDAFNRQYLLFALMGG